MIPDAEKREFVKKLTEGLASQGKVIEGGWAAYEYLSLQGTTELQRAEMRKAFFFGAQHLWASIFQVLDPGSEASESDLRRMNLIDAELRKFTDSIGYVGGFAT